MSEHYRPLTPYRGYGITKVWEENDKHRIVKGSVKYLIDDGEDYVGTEYITLSSARSQINGWTNIKTKDGWKIRDSQKKQIVGKFDQARKQGYNKTYQTFRKQYMKENENG